MTKQLISQHKNQNKLGLFIIMVFILSGCIDNQTVYYSSQDIPLLSWKIKDSIRFDIGWMDSLNTYQLDWEIRNDNHYRYQNIGLEVIMMKGATIIERDTLNYPITDEKGIWKGNGWGSLFQNSYEYKKMKFPYKGNYQFIVHPFMNDWDLKGIGSIGLKIQSVD